MRLTLRTLLAYMDDILDPQDQADLERRISESKLATDLLHQTRDATRRLRLGAPPVLGEGLEADPNVVAEYLDSTLPAESVNNYEKMCLESDVHLAEAASCHHVLTMVLGQPADVDPLLRARMYDLPNAPRSRAAGGGNLPGDEVDPAGTTTTIVSASPADSNGAANSPSHPTSQSASHLSSGKMEVPDYLREGQPSLVKNLAYALAACLLLAIGGYFLFGPDGLLRGDRQIAQNDGQDENVPVIEGVPAPSAGGDETTAPGTDDGLMPAPFVPGDGTANDSGNGATGLPTIPEATIPEATISDDIDLPTIDENPLPPVEPIANDPEMGDSAGTDPDDAELDGIDPTPDTPIDTNVDEASAVGNGDAGMPVEPKPTVPAVPVVGDNSGETAIPPAVADGPLGTFVSVHEILLRHDDADDSWRRLAKGTAIKAGDTLLALPTYRPELAMVSGLRVELSDVTRVLVGVTADGPAFKLAYGRMFISNNGANANFVTIDIDGQPQTFEIPPMAAVAVDVQRQFVPGMAIGDVASPSLAMIYVPDGDVVAIASDGARVPVEANSEWSITPDGAAKVARLAKQPEWLTEQKLDFLVQSASRNIEQVFDSERSARIQLLGFYENTKRSEERDLAARCAVHVGQFTPFVLALSDSAQRANWSDHIEMLRTAIASSPELAKQVKQTIADLRGDAEADELYEMIRGYSIDQLGATPQAVQTGVLLKLINWLEHDRLEYRVLAFHNLKQLTGKSLLYQPAGSTSTRDRAVRTWRERLDGNELVDVTE